MSIWETSQESEDEAAGRQPQSIDSLRAEIEKLSAKMEVHEQSREAMNERVQHIAEEIGEVRSMLIEAQKQSKNLEGAATRAAELVGAVQPEKLMAEVKKEDAKQEALRAKLEGSERIIANLVSETKSLRQKVELFKGAEAMLKLNNEVKTTLRNVELERATMEKHANTVELIFIEIQKKFAEYEKLSRRMDEVEASFREISKEFSAVKVKLTESASKQDMSEYAEKLNQKLIALDKLSKELEKQKKWLGQPIPAENIQAFEASLTGSRKLVERAKTLAQSISAMKEGAQQKISPAN